MVAPQYLGCYNQIKIQMRYSLEHHLEKHSLVEKRKILSEQDEGEDY